MKPRVLLVHPPIYDFAAYDFWLRPYGLLRVAGRIAPFTELTLFDYLDRRAPDHACGPFDRWDRGAYASRRIPTPPALADVPRHWRRLGRHRESFVRLLADRGPFDFALVQTGMTYWYPGVQEAIEDIRTYSPGALVALGGVYATICPGHAGRLGSDLVVPGSDLRPLWGLLGIAEPPSATPWWQGYERLDAGVMKLTDGCPFACTYCATAARREPFATRSVGDCTAELDALVQRGVSNIAFYDDALLFSPERVLVPFLQHVIERRLAVNFHTPNALHGRFVTPEAARLLVQAGFKTFYLGLESSDPDWQRTTGGKVACDDFVAAVENLRIAGAEPGSTIAYLLLGHPRTSPDRLEASMRFVHALGVRIMLADFSPIPGTPDGELCRRWTDLDEPLNHNKTAFPLRLLGATAVNRLKDLCRTLNRRLPG